MLCEFVDMWICSVNTDSTDHTDYSDRRTTRRCWVPNCPNSKPNVTSSKTRLFKFPKDVKRCVRWLEAIGEPSLARVSFKYLHSYRFVCQEHFRSTFITPQGRTTYSAVPEIFVDERPVLPRECVEEFLNSASAENECDYTTSSPPYTQDTCPDPGTAHHDFAGIDHDYAVTTIPRRSTIQVSLLKKKQEEASCRLLLEDVRKELCRLCGQKGSLLIPIFETSSTDAAEDMPISLKIEMYFPFKVKMDDPLPSHICSNCYNILNNWHELYVSSVAADTVLWKTFGRGFKRSTQNDSDADITRLDEDVLQNESIRPETNVKSRELRLVTLNSEQPLVTFNSKQPLVTLTSKQPLPPCSSEEPLVTLAETKEEQDVHCTECGKNKTLSISVEEASFNEEFDKNVASFRSVSYKCSFCFELFKGPPDRKIHMEMCRQMSTICDLCGLKIPCRKDLRRHKYTNHIKKIVRRRYLCDICDKCFKTAAGLRYHIECVHEKNLSPQYHCDLCLTLFVGEHHYRMHQKRHEKGLIKSVFQLQTYLHDGNPEDSQSVLVYACPVCQETFDAVFSFIVHLTTKKKIKCSTCQKVLSCEKHFMVHVCGQWKCQYCLKIFDKKTKWIVHERLHTGEKPFKCRTCDLTFRSYHNRRRHEEHHIPDYKCSYCGKCFRTKYVFQDHVSCHEGKVFSCNICDKTFGGRKYLCKHNNTFHKNLTVSS